MENNNNRPRQTAAEQPNTKPNTANNQQPRKTVYPENQPIINDYTIESNEKRAKAYSNPSATQPKNTGNPTISKTAQAVLKHARKNRLNRAIIVGTIVGAIGLGINAGISIDNYFDNITETEHYRENVEISEELRAYNTGLLEDQIAVYNNPDSHNFANKDIFAGTAKKLVDGEKYLDEGHNPEWTKEYKQLQNEGIMELGESAVSTLAVGLMGYLGYKATKSHIAHSKDIKNLREGKSKEMGE